MERFWNSELEKIMKHLVVTLYINLKYYSTLKTFVIKSKLILTKIVTKCLCQT